MRRLSAAGSTSSAVAGAAALVAASKDAPGAGGSKESGSADGGSVLGSKENKVLEVGEKGFHDALPRSMVVRPKPVWRPDQPVTVNGALSAGDPRLDDFFSLQGTFVRTLIWNPLSTVVVYGAGLEGYTAIQVGGMVVVEGELLWRG